MTGRRFGEGSWIALDAPIDLFGSGAIDDRCWWHLVDSGHVLEVLPAYVRAQIKHRDGDPRNNDIDNLEIARCSCYRDDVRDPNCRVHGPAATSSTVGRSSARARSTVGLYRDERRW